MPSRLLVKSTRRHDALSGTQTEAPLEVTLKYGSTWNASVRVLLTECARSINAPNWPALPRSQRFE